MNEATKQINEDFAKKYMTTVEAAQDKIRSLEASCERTSHKYIVEQYLVQIEALQQFINQQ